MKRYFFLSGILAHLLMVAMFGFWLRSIYWYGLPLPLYSQKVADDLRKNYPSASFLVPIFQYFASFEQKNFYFRTLDPTLSHSAGAQAEFRPELVTDVIRVQNSDTLRTALNQVKPGQQILLEPGDYSLSNTQELRTAGLPGQPIRLTGSAVHQVRVDLKREGLLLSGPHWIIENITFTGSCTVHDDCEHALHVVGKAQNVVIRNNVFRDFNAAIKVNALGKDYPDDGLLADNTFYNTSARATTGPATPIDIVATNHWLIQGNFIFDIQKSAGDRVSYAAFAKGNATGTVFERNLVMCEANLRGGQHNAIGLSFGGGGTGKRFFRDGQAGVEHHGGIMRNNIILHCPRDVGIYLNKAADTRIENNIIYNTAGVDVRYSASSAMLVNNVLSGRIQARNEGHYRAEQNLVYSRSFFSGQDQLKNIYRAPDLADFSLLSPYSIEPATDNQSLEEIEDFCGNTTGKAYLGAFSGDFCVKSVR